MTIAKYASWLSYGFQTFVLRRQLPYLFGLVITDQCNLNCFYCESKNSGRYHFTWTRPAPPSAPPTPAATARSTSPAANR